MLGRTQLSDEKHAQEKKYHEALEKKYIEGPEKGRRLVRKGGHPRSCKYAFGINTAQAGARTDFEQRCWFRMQTGRHEDTVDLHCTSLTL